MWEEVFTHRSPPPTYWLPRRDLNTQPFDPVPPTIRKSDTTLLPALHLQHAKQLAQRTSAAAHVCTTATGRPSLPTSQVSAGCQTTRVRTSACSLASSSHNAGRAFTTTTARLTALPSPHTDDCLLAATWDYDGTTRHATPRRRTPTTNFQHLCRQTSLYGSRDKFQAPSSPHIATRLPDNLDRTFQHLYVSKCSNHPRRLHLPEPRVPVVTYASTLKQQSPRGGGGGDVGASHKAVLRRTTGLPLLFGRDQFGASRLGRH
jgi:hypothetical protein